jgi:hypothetical protein
MPYSKRTCKGSPTCSAVLTGTDRYCPVHLAEWEKRRGSSTQRGYGGRHRQLRASWQRRIDAGEVIICWRPRCTNRITGTGWHLGHDDNDRRIYKGPECARCNTAAAALKRNVQRR